MGTAAFDFGVAVAGICVCGMLVTTMIVVEVVTLSRWPDAETHRRQMETLREGNRLAASVCVYSDLRGTQIQSTLFFLSLPSDKSKTPAMMATNTEG